VTLNQNDTFFSPSNAERNPPARPWRELFLAKIRTLNFEKLLSSGGQKGRGLWGRNFCPPSLFRRRRISCQL